MLFNYFLGIDISKLTLDVALLSKKKDLDMQIKITNDKAGFKELNTWLRQQKVPYGELLVCAEHTGTYGYDIQIWLESKKISYAFVPALEIQRSIGLKRGKNDLVDAKRIAEYAYLRRETITLSKRPSEDILKLKTLLGERKMYVRNRAGMMARKDAMSKYESAESRRRREQAIKKFQDYIDSLEAQMEDIVKSNEEIFKNYTLIRTVVGIGLVNALNTIVYTNNFTSFQNARQYACYIGVAPFEHKSGTSVRGRTQVSSLSNHQLKSELTMAARNAVFTDPGLRAYYQRKMSEKGNAPGSYGIVLNAVKFKLILRMFSVVKSGTPYKVLSYY